MSAEKLPSPKFLNDLGISKVLVLLGDQWNRLKAKCGFGNKNRLPETYLPLALYFALNQWGHNDRRNGLQPYDFDRITSFCKPKGETERIMCEIAKACYQNGYEIGWMDDSLFEIVQPVLEARDILHDIKKQIKIFS
jgi:hypothetical protein